MGIYDESYYRVVCALIWRMLHGPYGTCDMNLRSFRGLGHDRLQKLINIK